MVGLREALLGRPGTARVPLPPLLFAVPFGLAALLELVRPTTLLPVPARGIAGGLLVALALGFAAWAELALRRAGTSPMPWRPSERLAIGGPYRVTRNPIYLAYVVLYVGLALLLDTAWPLVVLPLVLAAVDRFVVQREEAYLAARFGEAYDAYRRRVRRWL